MKAIEHDDQRLHVRVTRRAAYVRGGHVGWLLADAGVTRRRWSEVHRCWVVLTEDVPIVVAYAEGQGRSCTTARADA